mmetsp:Transcript_31721/g.31157  ORF Transcript_31721/g.31157 Transcript_31721/m.31157 type:complete len:89 (-) Transcript_31721:202-468(-)
MDVPGSSKARKYSINSIGFSPVGLQCSDFSSPTGHFHCSFDSTVSKCSFSLGPKRKKKFMIQNIGLCNRNLWDYSCGNKLYPDHNFRR